VEVISMTIDDLLEQALRLGNPFQTLRDLAARRLEEGETEGASACRLREGCSVDCVRKGVEADEDTIMDVMDCLVGWCRPEFRL